LDHGNSFQEATDMGSGSFGDYEEGANGLKWDFKLVANAGGGYDLWSQMRDAELAVVRPWQITTLTGIDNAPISARESWRLAHRGRVLRWRRVHGQIRAGWSEFRLEITPGSGLLPTAGSRPNAVR
jgi:hypothetical protein